MSLYCSILQYIILLTLYCDKYCIARFLTTTLLTLRSSAVTHQRDGCIKVGGSDLAIFSSTLIGFIS